jgi:outer membrane protein assembly factor BamB
MTIKKMGETRASTFVAVVFALTTSFLIEGCSTAPKAREVKFNVSWIRSTLSQENFGYRHSERTAPLIDGDSVYAGNGIDSFTALDKISGRTLWNFRVKNGVESGSAIEGDSIFFGASDGHFYALDKNSGRTLWTFPTRIENLAAPLVTQGAVYFLAGNNILYALDAKTGKQLWLYNRGDVSSLSVRGGSKPAIFKGNLYVGFSDGYLAAVNTHDGSLVWERKLSTNLKFVDVDATPVVDEENIWISSYDGALFCLSRSDGQVQWRLDDGGSVAVSIDGDTLYYSSLTQNVYALNKKTGAQKWKFSFEEKYGVPTQPVIYKGLVIAGTSDGAVYALSQQTGKLLTQYNPGAGVFATPTIDPITGFVYVMSNQANVHALKVAWHRPQDNLEWLQ